MHIHARRASLLQLIRACAKKRTPGCSSAAAWSGYPSRGWIATRRSSTVGSGSYGRATRLRSGMGGRKGQGRVMGAIARALTRPSSSTPLAISSIAIPGSSPSTRQMSRRIDLDIPLELLDESHSGEGNIKGPRATGEAAIRLCARTLSSGSTSDRWDHRPSMRRQVDFTSAWTSTIIDGTGSRGQWSLLAIEIGSPDVADCIADATIERLLGHRATGWICLLTSAGTEVQCAIQCWTDSAHSACIARLLMAASSFRLGHAYQCVRGPPFCGSQQSGPLGFGHLLPWSVGRDAHTPACNPWGIRKAQSGTQ